MHEVGTKADIDSERDILIAVYTDISKQHDMEEKLQLSNLQLENIINAIAGEWRFIKYQISLKPYIFPMEFQH